VKDWPPPAHAGGDPDWLTERLARETATHGGTEWNGAWKRRLASWGAAGVLLALLAGGALWLYEQSRVEGALVVVANTNPVSEGNTVRPGSGAALPAVQASPSVGSPAVANPSVASADKNAAVLEPVSAMPATTVPTAAVGGTAGPSTASSASETAAPIGADRTVVAVALDAAPAPQPKRSRSHAGKQRRADTSVDARENERSHRQRSEETLMQCRAHGYDERQCLQRGCEMTRYGFACKG
jgi:hypothetical protein